MTIATKPNSQPAVEKLHLHVWSEGDASVGMSGRCAEVILDQDEAYISASDLELIKTSLQHAFEEIWGDDVQVLTQREVDEDSAAYESD